ncbi:hypothetical protein [Virgibacillus dokdonensis]|uniref:Uncharacterized protein n=1 Tax=Virgibacillus dokdonensis TaxID=302167 RepID=A0A2K9J4D5_9BACI|nr:hypothetical protein [Virgibacillus dokdonensis]AUJ26584.1 hypothetical protein A21D_03550 [Virgibacillus dokdonensis]
MVEPNYDRYNQPEAFDDLTSKEQKHLTDWIKNNIAPIKSFNTRQTSYGLKHRFEDDGGFYIGNGAFKGAMLACGFKVKDKSAKNWVFNVSEKSIKIIRNRIQ